MGGTEKDGSAANVGSLFAAIVLKSQPGADFISFATSARYKEVGHAHSSLFTVVDNIRRGWTSGSTNFHSIFETARERYDNIIILSDNEGWTLGTGWQKEAGAPTTARRKYEQRHGALPFIVSFDLTGQQTMMFPEDSVAVLSGFSDKVFTLLRELRKNPGALIDEVGKTDFAAINEGDEE